jgi:hypothetical protein
MGAARFDLGRNHAQHPFHVHKWLVGREAEHCEPLTSEKIVPAFVVLLLFSMLRTVELDDHFRRQACEVGDVVAQGMLAAKLHTQLLHSQARPQPALRVGHRTSKFASVLLCG